MKQFYLQIQDKDYNVLVRNHPLGEYSKYSTVVDKKVARIVALYPTATRWEVRDYPYESQALI